MLVTIALAYLIIGLTQVPVIEKMVSASVSDLPYNTPLFLKIFVWGFSLVFMVLLEPLFSLVFYVVKPWIKK